MQIDDVLALLSDTAAAVGLALRAVEGDPRRVRTDLLDRAWRGPEWLPTLEEIRDPGTWIERVDTLERAAK